MTLAEAPPMTLRDAIVDIASRAICQAIDDHEDGARLGGTSLWEDGVTFGYIDIGTIDMREPVRLGLDAVLKALDDPSTALNAQFRAWLTDRIVNPRP